MNTANTERSGFSTRLKQSLKDAHYSPDGCTNLAREFNIRFDGRPITVHAARKWLVGESIPTQEKLRTIADWLNVSAEWLRFGGEQSDTINAQIDAKGATGDRFDVENIKIVADMQRLDMHHRNMAREFIQMIAGNYLSK